MLVSPSSEVGANEFREVSFRIQFSKLKFTFSVLVGKKTRNILRLKIPSWANKKY